MCSEVNVLMKGIILFFSLNFKTRHLRICRLLKFSALGGGTVRPSPLSRPCWMLYTMQAYFVPVSAS